MDRRTLTVVVLITVLAACSGPAPTTTASDPSAYDSVEYLFGVTSEYSVRLDELRPDRPQHRRTTLPHAVVAGDAALTVAAALFRCGDVFALDLIIQNRGDETLEIDRDRMALFDDNGDALASKIDWKEGVNYGLRATRDAQRLPVHLNQTFLTTKSEEPRKVFHKPNDPLTSNMGRPAAEDRLKPMGYDWLDEPLPNGGTVTLSSVFALPGGESTPFWAYWRAESPRGEGEVALPLTAMVTLGKKRLLFRFVSDAPGP